MWVGRGRLKQNHVSGAQGGGSGEAHSEVKQRNIRHAIQLKHG